MATVAQQAPTGKVRLLKPVGGTPGTGGEIAINGKRYLCGKTEHGYRLGTYDPETDRAAQYDVNFLFDHCTCPDYKYRARLCKHCLALAALWKAGKIS